MQAARRIGSGKMGRIRHNGQNRNMLYNTRRYITDYQTKNQEITPGLFHSNVFQFLFVFGIVAATQASWGILDNLLPFSFGQPTQGAYFPPHCRYITPYDDIVRTHKKKLKMQQEFNVDPNETD